MVESAHDGRGFWRMCCRCGAAGTGWGVRAGGQRRIQFEVGDGGEDFRLRGGRRGELYSVGRNGIQPHTIILL